MIKTDVTNRYTMEELIPLVGKLTEEFTSKESSSVTYERARQFMEAVIYCIAHCDCESNRLAERRQLTAEEAYRIGYEVVIKMVQETREKYNRLMQFFDSYGNRNYQDTVCKAMPGFFLHYDAKFAPIDNIITMDYPIFTLDWESEGIDRIRSYVDAIWDEQCYLMKFPRSYIISELRAFHSRYENEFFNLREIVELQMASDDLKIVEEKA